MPSFGEQLLTQAMRDIAVRRRQERTALEKVESDKLSLLADPNKLDKLVANFTTMVSPSKAKLSTDFASKVDATDANIPSDHPLKGYGHNLRDSLRQALSDPSNEGISVKQMVLHLSGRELVKPGESGKTLYEESHAYKYRKDYRPGNWFGAFGEDEDVRALPGYEEFKEEKAATVPVRHDTTYKEAMGYGAGFAGLGQLGSRALIKWGGRRAVSWGTARLVTGAALGPHIALAAAAAVPMFKVWDFVAGKIDQSHFGKSQGAVTKFLAELAIGGVLPGYAGHKILTKSLTKATQAGIIKGVTEDMLMRLPTAKNAILLGKTRALKVKEDAIADAAMEAAGKSKTAKRQVFKAAEDIYEPRRAGMEGLTKVEKREVVKDLTAPFKKQFLGVKTTKKEQDISRVFANFTTEQSDAALAKAKTVGIRKATQQVKEGIDVLADQRQKEISDGFYKGLKKVDESYYKESYTTDELLQGFKSKKKARLLVAGKKKVKKAEKVIKEVNDAVDKEVLAAKIAELEGETAAAKIRFDKMEERFKGGLVQTKSGAVIRKKGKKAVAQVPDEVVKAKEASLPKGSVEVSYQEAKRRLLKSMMAKKDPVKEEMAVKPAIENAKIAIGNQVKKQENRPLLKGETDDAEWLARAGESESIEDIFATTDGLMKEEFDPSKWKFFIAGATAIPLLNIFDPNTGDMQVATAGVSAEGLKVLAGSKVSKVVMDSLKGKAKSVQALYKSIIEGNYAYIPAAEGQKFFGERQNAISVSKMVAERGETLADQVIRSKSLPFGFDRLMGMAGFGRLYLKAGGDATIELGNRHLVSGNMTEKGLIVLDNILKDIKNYNANPKEIMKLMEPLADRFAPQVGAYNAIEYQIKIMKGVVNKNLKLLKKKKLKSDDRQVAIAEIEEANKSLKLLKSAEEELSPAVRQFNKDYETTTQMLAKNNPAVRMSLAAEDTVDFKHRPWLKNMMTFEEMEAVGYHKRFMEDYATEVARVYGKDAIIESRPYIHHAFHPSWRTKFINDELARLKLGIKPHPPYTQMHSRSRYSRQMVPHIGYNTGRYIPDVEKRIQMQEFWGRGKKDGWYALWKSPMVQGSNALREFFQRIHNAGIPAADTWSNRSANWYSAIEVLRLLGYSTSVAFKHLFKIPGTWAQLGFTSAMKHVPESLQVFARTFAQGKRGKSLMAQLNLSGVKGEKAATDLVAKTFARQYGYMNTIMDMDMSVNVNSTFETGLKWLNEKGGVLVRGVEHFDRVHGILAASEQAAKKGMTAQQATYGLVDTILKNNFLSGTLNPSWMRSPKVRALFLFQNTAFKIFERRLVGGIKALELSKAVGKSVKEKGLRQSLKELRGVKQFIKEGEHEFKESIILDALNADRGYFGTPQSVQFMKEMLIMGAIIGAGGVAGVDLWQHVNHLPFLKGHTKYPVLATSPIFNAMFDVKGNRAAAAKASKAPEFLMTDFLKEWLWQGKYGPYPQSVKKGMRLSNNDIPKRYKDSKLKYLFSIPATE